MDVEDQREHFPDLRQCLDAENGWDSGSGHRIELPFAVDALEGVQAAIFEGDR